MIEELLDKLETNMKDLEDKYCEEYVYNKDINEALQNFKTAMTNEWNYFIPKGDVNTLGINFINIYGFDSHWSLTETLITVVMKNTDRLDVKLALANFKKRQIDEDFKA